MLLDLTLTKQLQSLVKKVDALVKAGISEQEFMRQTYESIVSSSNAMAAYKTMFEVLLNQERGETLFFCSHGRDRTGIAAMLILTALGVPKKTIYEDYLLPTEKHKHQQRLIAVLEGIHYVDHTRAEFARAFASP